MLKSIYRNSEGVFLTYPQVCEKYNIGINTAKKISQEAGALIRIGRICRVDDEVFSEFIRAKFRVNNDH